MLETMTMNESAQLLPEYADWLDRVRMTRESVAYCCFHRLHRDAALAERVSVEVLAGLLARPKVFQYYGLPFSGRIAHLTEMAIGRATERLPGGACTWAVLEEALVGLPLEQQEVVVQVCVEGCDDGDLAAILGCAEAEAQRRCEETLARLEQCSALVLPVNAHRSPRVQSAQPPSAGARVTRSDP
ncbi:MAG: hypothetical protein QOJ85_714 [Solirubrobacteraceae bacterium]|jgi:hypothetical protein|nr:hypothetical protein [Solirubrobacteraceae bacterium]MEA2244366.1 hypothetical protein [Solirubrobacteraceae bacterium]